MKKIMIALTALALAVSAGAAEKKAAAKEEAAPAKKSSTTTLNAGLSLTDGNSETMTANGSLKTEGEKEGLGSVLAGAEANYGEDTQDDVTDTTVNNAKVYANVKKTLSPMTFAYGDASGMYDDVADIDYRAITGLGLGAYLVKNDKRTLSLEAGPSYVWEEVADVRDDYLALRVAQRYTCQATKTTKLFESVEYIPDTGDFDSYLLNAEIGVEVAMSERLSLRVVLQDKYDSTPAADAERNDLSLIAGIGFTL